MKFKAWVFDLDGTLVDSNIDFQSMRAALQLTDGQDILAVIDQLPPTDRESALEIVFQHELAAVRDSKPIVGALEFVQKLKARGYPCAILTRNARSLASQCLQMHGFDIDLVVAREDAPAKPKPDGLIKIAQMFKVQVDELFFVGDYIYDLHAGLAAGTPTALYIPSSADFETEGACFIFQSFDQLSERVLTQ